VVAGVFAGLGMALALARLLQGLLYGVSAFDAATFGIVVTALLSIAGLAAALPAFRATRVDPSAALRVE
jgi:ABC-type antimicrobial peptide transport system permease subunit